MLFFNRSPKGSKNKNKMKKSTTDVLVVTNLPSSGTGLSLAGNGLTLTGNYTTTGGFVSTYTNQLTYPSYNDFWKFDEELDLLWKSFFNNDGYRPIKEKVGSVPCDVQETDSGLKIEIAVVGLNQEDIEIIVDSETLRVAYRKSDDEKKKEEDSYRYFHRSIKKASFDLAWKISSKYDLQNIKANLEKGLLILNIPYAKENKPKRVKIG